MYGIHERFNVDILAEVNDLSNIHFKVRIKALWNGTGRYG